jgi:hypothetical protein
VPAALDPLPQVGSFCDESPSKSTSLFCKLETCASEFCMLSSQTMNDPFRAERRVDALLCPGCQTHPGWYRRDQLMIMGCRCGGMALDYARLPFLPQTDREWTQWFLFHNPPTRDLMLRGEGTWNRSNGYRASALANRTLLS